MPCHVARKTYLNILRVPVCVCVCCFVCFLFFLCGVGIHCVFAVNGYTFGIGNTRMVHVQPSSTTYLPVVSINI